MSDPAALARTFVRSVAAKDRDALTSVLDGEIDFRGLTPSFEWRARTPDEVAEIVFGSWFEPHDHVQEVLDVGTKTIADRHHVRYVFRVESQGELYLVEQQGYFDAPDGRITRMSVMCSGFRPWEEPPSD
ncbi:MAG TPA: hypothetical protein VIC58_00200 [Actinomycetota bacterium]|jgi:hypothetical protein